METLIEAKLVNLEASMSSMWCNQQHVLHVPEKKDREEHSDIKISCHKCAGPQLFENGTPADVCLSLWTDPSSVFGEGS